MSKQILIVLGILLVFGCADVSKENQLQTGCSEGSESTPANEYVSPAPAPAPTPAPTVVSWAGIKQFGSSGDDAVLSVTTDNEGSVYVTGSTSRHIYVMGNSCGYSWNYYDLITMKFNSGGEPQWCRRLGSTLGQRGHSIVSDSTNNIYVTGWTFGSHGGYSNLGWRDIITAKYDSNGSQKWLKQFGDSGDDLGFGITLDNSGNVYVTGGTQSGLDGNTNSGAPSYNMDLFIIKYDSEGNRSWTKQPGKGAGVGLANDSAGNIYLTGVDGGGLTKYNSAGVQQWNQKLLDSNGTSVISQNQISIDSSDSIYLAGSTTGNLGGYSNAGEADIFIVKYSSTGVQQWIRQTGTASADYPTSITIDSKDNVYITGNTKGALGSTSNAGENDIFVMSYNSNGTQQWVRQIGTTSSDSPGDIVVDPSDNIFVVGTTSGVLDANGYVGAIDGFVLKYDSDGNLQ